MRNYKWDFKWENCHNLSKDAIPKDSASLFSRALIIFSIYLYSVGIKEETNLIYLTLHESSLLSHTYNKFCSSLTSNALKVIEETSVEHYSRKVGQNLSNEKSNLLQYSISFFLIRAKSS